MTDQRVITSILPLKPCAISAGESRRLSHSRDRYIATCVHRNIAGNQTRCLIVSQLIAPVTNLSDIKVTISGFQLHIPGNISIDIPRQSHKSERTVQARTSLSNDGVGSGIPHQKISSDILLILNTEVN